MSKREQPLHEVHPFFLNAHVREVAALNGRRSLASGVEAVAKLKFDLGDFFRWVMGVLAFAGFSYLVLSYLLKHGVVS